MRGVGDDPVSAQGRTWRPRLGRPRPSDAAAAVAVALVLIPQSLAYAVLAGMPPATGLAVGAAATVAAAPFVSSPHLQTGPVAITGLLTIGAISPLADVASAEYVGLAALLAVLVGLVRIGFGLLGIGAVAYIMSRPVLAGFVPAAGLLIALSQVPDILGLEPEGASPVLRAAHALVDIGNGDPLSAGLGVLTVVVVVLGRRVHALFPSVLLAVVLGVMVSLALGYQGAVVGELPTSLPAPDLALPWGRAADLVGPVMVVALVGFAEPAAIARTYAQQTGAPWDADREFVSQGVANLAAGAVGGFPAGGSFSRSAVAREAGGQTAWTGLLTGVIVMAAIPFSGLLHALPTAVLGGVILASVLSLLWPDEALALRDRSRQQVLVAGTTFVVTLLAAPQVHIGVLVGVMAAVGAHLRREANLTLPAWRDGDTLHVRPTGVLFFGSAHRVDDGLTALLREHPGVTGLVLHMDRLGRADVTGAMALRDALEAIARSGVEPVVDDLTPTSRKILTRTLPPRMTVGPRPDTTKARRAAGLRGSCEDRI